MSEQNGSERETCPSCSKLAYRSRRDANTVINSMHRRRMKGGKSRRVARARAIPVRAYECPEGNGWHLTKVAGWDRT